MIYPARIIVIDDELGMREGSRRILVREGHQVDIAESGEEGLEYIKKNKYDLALVDYKMPGIDGFQVLQQVKEISPDTMVLIVTAYASIEAAVEATKKGAYDYISKPFTPDEFLTSVNRALERRNLIMETLKLKEEREKNLLDLNIEKSRIKTIMNSLNEGVIVTNTRSELVLYNLFIMKLFDFTQDKIGKQINASLNNETIINQINQILYSKPDKTSALSSEVKINDNIYKVDTTLVKDENNNILGSVTVLKDISEEKKIEQLKSQFVSMVSHELRAPIAAIKGYIDALLSIQFENDINKTKSILQRSSLRADSLLNLINDLLAISRMESKTKKRNIEEIDIADVLEQHLEFFGNEIKKKNLILEKDISNQMPHVCIDRGEIDIILTNLISNAIKYNKEGGKISVSLKTDDNYLKISVSDTGIGLKEEDKKNLFQDFYRAKNEHTKYIIGTGLGLSIVKRIIESYHGKIKVESEYEKGSTFNVFLPAKENAAK